MPERPLEQLTLREKCTGAERLTSELIEHIEHGFIPQTRQLQQTVRGDTGVEESEELTDRAIRNRAAQLLESDDFTGELHQKLDEYLSAIADEVGQIVD